MMNNVKFLRNKVFLPLSIIFVIIIGAACSSNTGAGDTKQTTVSTSESGNVDKDLPISRYEASFDVDLEDLTYQNWSYRLCIYWNRCFDG